MLFFLELRVDEVLACKVAFLSVFLGKLKRNKCYLKNFLNCMNGK